MPTKVIDRFNLLKSGIENLNKDRREDLKPRLMVIARQADFHARKNMKNVTPQRDPDDSRTFSYRKIGWKKYGLQDYIIRASDIPSYRNYGMTLREGWDYQQNDKNIDFIGSTKDFINMSTSLYNTAPHASMALLGNYRKSSWDIPGAGGLRNGRRAMLWSFKGRPIFRWVDANFSGLSSFVGPVTFHAPQPLTHIIETGERTLRAYREDFLVEIRKWLDGLKDYDWSQHE